MMRNKSLWAVLSCVAVLGLTAGCSDDDAVCGDGVIEGSEDCDLDQLGGATCSDVGAFTGGTLACSSQCVYDLTNCGGVECGNGINEFGEICDCGDDLMNLPAGCTDINGGANSNCSDTCTRVDVCGDGQVTGAEECDCGNAAWVSELPTDCAAYNGATGPCYDDCTEDPNAFCEGENYDVCTGESPDFCCEDPWGTQLDCKSSITSDPESRCGRTCADHTDCYRNTWCLTSLGYDQCWIAICSPGPDADIPAEINGVCQVPGGGEGICSPSGVGRYDADDDELGICIEPGGLAHGDVCPFADALGGVDSTDRSEPGCDGFCYGQAGMATGNCRNACNWKEAYAEVVYGGAAQWHPCPTGSACMSDSMIEPSGSADDYGWRGRDASICVDTAASGGKDSCSLITGQLMDGSGQTCATMGTWTEGRCELYWDAYDGSLIGECQDGTVPSVATVWGACTAGTDVCPTGSDCIEPDLFDGASMATVCVPRCDTEHADGVRQHCDDLGAAITGDGTPTCQSQSWLFGAAGAADIHKTRLGYCGY